MEKNELQIYYNEPRLAMTLPGRMFVRFSIYVGYISLFGVTLVLLLSANTKPQWFAWLGALLALFLLDRAAHFGNADRSLERIPRDASLNAAHYLTPRTFSFLERAFERSTIGKGDLFLHLTRLLIKRREVRESLSRMDVDLEELRETVEKQLIESRNETSTRADMLSAIGKLAIAALRKAAASGNRFVEPKDLLSAMTEVGSARLVKIFRLFEINASDLDAALIFSRFADPLARFRFLPKNLGGFSHRPRLHQEIKHHVMNRAWTARPTPTLDAYSSDYTDLALMQKIGFLIGHEKEYAQMIDVISRPGAANVLLVGEPGSGRETLIAHLASEIVQDRVPESLFDKRLVELRVNSVISGAKSEDLSARLTKIVQEINAAGNIILYVPDIDTLAKASGQNLVSAADILLPALTGGAFPVIGAAYPREFKQLIEPKTEFREAFEVIQVEEVREEDAIKILTYESLLLEKGYGVIISFGAIKQAVVLAHKYFRDKLLPGSAEELLKAALADATQRKDAILSPARVIAVAEQKVNIPIHKAGKGEAEQLLNLEKTIHEQLVDQEEAVNAVGRAMREYRSGLSRSEGPIATFLFVGPTGVGKTELAKILAKIQFGSEEAMARFDMSEYQDRQSVYRFIGAPDGSQGGTLTDAILKKPYSLVLLDEFEKAHPDILNLFLSVFDDGRLTDSTGRVVDFKNTIIIATSNAQSEFIKSEIEKNRPIADIAEDLKKKLTEQFKPELLNRFSGVVVFKNLSQSDTEAIARLQLGKLAAKALDAQGIILQFDDMVVKKIAEWGYSPVFGARPLRNIISDKLQSVLAEKILKNEAVKGETLTISVRGEEIEFSK